jgi:hypothetical protein
MGISNGRLPAAEDDAKQENEPPCRKRTVNGGPRFPFAAVM